ncbi:MAG TPA: ATP-binding cassette domain-containing protein [Acidimicrobiales bacterium]|jgi:ABC-2 type transport system ATP-binding protein|nr:ATP-binding cassette domain-containing protein [Acidimicrobiales bacterium]
MGDHVIEIDGLVRRFGDVVAVDGLNLAVERGEVYGFLGPNGAGKSTTVRVLTTLLSPTAGTARVGGLDVVADAVKVRLRIGLALQEASLDEKQTGREILDLQARLYGLRGESLRRRLADVMALADLGDAIDRLVGTYSGGMRRRLDLAAALVHDPDILFLDEPTTGLDPVSRTAVWGEVQRLRGRGATVFLTTQYLEEADVLSDRVGIIDDGKLVVEGPPAELKHRVGRDLVVVELGGDPAGAAEAVSGLPGVDDVRLTDHSLVVATANGASLVGPVAVRLAEKGLETASLTVRTPTLDDVFLEATGHRLRGEEER